MSRSPFVSVPVAILAIAALLTPIAKSALAQGQPASSISLSELSPSSVTTGGASVMLTVRGAGFTRNSQVRINGHQRSTTFASANELRASLPASDLASPGSLQVTAFTPARGSTNTLVLTVVGANPAPVASDTQAPTLIVPSNISLTATSANGAIATFTTTATDNSGTATVGCQPASGTVFPIGSTTVTCTARDPSGNTSTGTFVVTVTAAISTADTEPPRFENFGSFTHPATSASGAAVTFRAPFATDNSGSVTVICEPAADVIHNFPVGTTTVTCTARDPSNNLATLTFTITITPLATMAVTQLDPPNGTPGALGFSLNVRGSGFTSGMVVRWNGTTRNTSFFAPSAVSAFIQTADIATAGTARVTVFDPSTGAESAPAEFFIDASRNGIPRITALGQASGTAGPSVGVSINGDGFVPGSVVRVNGVDLPATAVHLNGSHILGAEFPAGVGTTPGVYRLTVFNPGANGGESNTVLLTLTAP